MTIDIALAAARLDAAACAAVPVRQLSDAAPFDTDSAYAIQAALIARRVERGERPVGIKMGFTSRAKMLQMGIADVIFGHLTDAMQIEHGGEVDLSRFIHPRAEPEIAFLLREPLQGQVTPAEALRAVAAVAPAIEIIDSRYRDFRFSLGDVIADNSSSSAFVVGEWVSPPANLANLAMTFRIDGDVHASVSSAAILGDPLLSLAAAARLTSQYGEGLQGGAIVLAGGAAAAVALAPGMRIDLDVERMGSTVFSVGRLIQ